MATFLSFTLHFHMAGALGSGFSRTIMSCDRKRLRCDAASDGSVEVDNASRSWKFPLRAAATAGALALVGDAGAQLVAARTNGKKLQDTRYRHDWKRSLRMWSYGFVIYGPMSQVWYEVLDRALPETNARNLFTKVGLNQVVLGPSVIALVFAWNHLWQNKLQELPAKYKRLALPTLIDGWKYWIPVSMLNFGVIPLQARVAFMSSCSILWNLYLSLVTMSK